MMHRGLLLAATWLALSVSSALAAPRLVIVVSVDQWAYRYLQWFDGRFPPHGLVERIEQQGAWYTNCCHAHALTKTAPGHAALLTGAHPERHGIVSNDWYERRDDKSVYCVADNQVQTVGSTDPDASASPRRLLADTVGDQLKLATGGKSKVFGVAVKDRAAILMAGHAADAAYWMDGDGQWITSTYYRKDLPGYIRELNQRASARAFAGKSWELLVGCEHYRHGATEDSRHEAPPAGMSADFPHVMPAADDRNMVRVVTTSPFGNDATLAAALQIVSAEELGRDDFPDLLVVNLSSNDYVGHAFGPESLEVEDMTYRTDQQLAQFVDAVADLVGRDTSWEIYFTADHGVAPILERAAQAGLPATRRPLGDLRALANTLDSHLRRVMDITQEDPRVVLRVNDFEVYLNQQHPALAGAQWELAQRITRDWLASHPAVIDVWTRTQLLENPAGDDLTRRVRRSFHPQRSGDVLFVLRPYTLQSGSGTTHGSPWDYDAHVPLLALGIGPDNALKLGKIDLPVAPGQIAPTISQHLNIPCPSMCQVSPLPTAH
jgi:hypothetical protein